MSVHRFIHADPEETAAACAKHMLQLLRDRLSGESFATMAISGGSTPALLFRHMAKTHFHWDNVHIFWVDERAVPPADKQSNYRMAEETLIGPAHIPRGNVHRVIAELRPEEAAEKYAAELRDFFQLTPGQIPQFDIIHRGMGSEGHTASLFPGEPLLDDRTGLTAAVLVEKLAQWRITLLPGVLLAARHTVMLVAGGDKAATVHAVLEEPYNLKLYPAQLGVHDGRGVTWFLDRAAASQLTS